MATEGDEGNPWGEVLFLLVCLTLIVVFWYVAGGNKNTSLGSLFLPSPTQVGGNASTTGGTSSASSTTPAHTASFLPFWTGASATKTFISSAAPFVPSQSSQFTPNNVPGANVPLPGLTRSPYSGEVTISDDSGVHSSVPSGEYITIYANYGNAGPINISGWQLKSTITGQGGVIGGGMETVVLNEPAQLAPIMLKPGDAAVITTGASPIGTSFRENKCEGYIQQFQHFTPSLAQACPLPQNELSLSTNAQLAQDPACVAAVSQLRPCQTLIYAPQNIDSACSDFIVPRFTYNGCVASHHTDQDFEGRQWRIFLDRNGQLWDNQTDQIVLLDAQGQLVSSVSY